MRPSGWRRQLSSCRSNSEALPHIHRPYEHRPPRVERQILKPPPCVKPTHPVIQWMREHPHAADVLRHNQRRPQREQQQRRRMSLPLERLVHCKLAEQRGGHRIWLVALLRLGQERALDLRGAQADVADDPPGRDIGDDVRPRYAAGLVGPGVPAEPGVQRVPPAIEQEAVIVLGQRARWRDACDRVSLPRSASGARVRSVREWPRSGG